MIKHIFLGKKPQQRVHAPKIIEHLYLTFGSVMISVCLFVLVFSYLNHPNNRWSIIIFSLLNQIKVKIILALMLGFWITILINSIRIMRIISKTDQAKWLVYFEIIGALMLITAPLVIVFTIASFKYNEIVYQ